MSDIRVRRDRCEKTCNSHPAQWEMTTDDDLWIYARYRFGVFSAGMGRSLGEAIDAGVGWSLRRPLLIAEVDDQDGGTMTTARMEELLSSQVEFYDKEETKPSQESPTRWAQDYRGDWFKIDPSRPEPHPQPQWVKAEDVDRLEDRCQKAEAERDRLAETQIRELQKVIRENDAEPKDRAKKGRGDFLGDDLSGVHTCHAECPCHDPAPEGGTGMSDREDKCPDPVPAAPPKVEPKPPAAESIVHAMSDREERIEKAQEVMDGFVRRLFARLEAEIRAEEQEPS